MKLTKDYIVISGIVVIITGAIFSVNNSLLTSGLVIAAGALCYWTKQLQQQKISQATNQLTEMQNAMKEAARLIADLGKDGEITSELIDKENDLLKAIQTVDADIKQFNEKERKRNWRIEGLAKFSELLRAHEKSAEDLSSDIIKSLVKYIGANQGAIFLYRNDDATGEEYLQMTGCYAYQKKRFREKHIEIGQGLVGQCYLERETIYLLDIPEDYVNITSGLGEATPTNVILVPLLLNKKVYGVIELATFIPLEKYRVLFLEQLAENIASVFAALNNNEKTAKLLHASQSLTSELQSQEEEMRQSMEELTATQEEMGRKQSELDGIIGAIDKTMGMVEINTRGEISYSNNIINNVLGYTDQEMLRRTYKDVIGIDDFDKEFLHRIINEQVEATHYKTLSKKREAKWLTVSFSPIKDQSGTTRKILALARDITKRKLQEIEFEKLSLVADNTNNAVIITDKDGYIEFVNRGFTNMTGYSEDEVMGKKPGNFLQGKETNPDTVNRIREALKKREPIYEEILNYTKTGDSYWISMAVNPVFNEKGKLERFISIQADITNTKKQALDYSYKLQAISKSNAIVEFDTQGTIIDVNSNFLNVFNYSKEEVIGRHHQMLVTEDERKSPEYQQFWSKLGKGEFINDEFQRVTKDGKRIWLKGIYNPIYNLNGVPYKIVKFVTDITQQKELELEKHRQEVELSNQMEAINKTIASVEFDLNGYIIHSNEIFNSITGIHLNGKNRLHYSDIIPPGEVLKPQTELMWNNLQQGKFFSGEFKFHDQDGKELWLVGTFNPIKNIQGEPYKVMMYAQFNTSEKEKQKDLTGIVNALKKTTLTMELNPDGTFKSANELFMQQFGYSRLELREKSLSNFLNGSSVKTGQKLLAQINENPFIEHNLEYITAEGNTKKYSTTLNAIYDLEDKLAKVIVIMIDRDSVIKV